MDDLRKDREKKKLQQNIKWTNFKVYVRKHKWKIILLILITLVAIFPAQLGQFFGNWIHEFITNFLKY